MMMSVMPLWASFSMMIPRIGFSPIGIIGFGRIVVYGRRRLPFPPARITACIVSPYTWY